MCCPRYCMHVYSVTSDSLRPHGLQSTRLLCPWNFSGNNTGGSYHFFLQGKQFQGDTVVKNLPANAGDTRDLDSIPGSGRSPECNGWEWLSSLGLHVIVCPCIALCSLGFWAIEGGAHAWNSWSRMHKVITDAHSHREESWSFRARRKFRACHAQIPSCKSINKNHIAKHSHLCPVISNWSLRYSTR